MWRGLWQALGPSGMRSRLLAAVGHGKQVNTACGSAFGCVVPGHLMLS